MSGILDQAEKKNVILDRQYVVKTLPSIQMSASADSEKYLVIIYNCGSARNTGHSQSRVQAVARPREPHQAGVPAGLQFDPLIVRAGDDGLSGCGLPSSTLQTWPGPGPGPGQPGPGSGSHRPAWGQSDQTRPAGGGRRSSPVADAVDAVDGVDGAGVAPAWCY